MARRRMSLRAIAQMKRENRALRSTLDSVRRGPCGTRILKVSLTAVDDGKIKTAQILGYTTILRDNFDGTFGVLAVDLSEAR